MEAVLAFLATKEGIALVTAAGTAIWGWLFKKKIDRRWQLILTNAPRVFLTVEKVFKGKGKEAKNGGFRARMDEILRAHGFKELNDKDWRKLAEWVADEAIGLKPEDWNPNGVTLPLRP